MKLKLKASRKQLDCIACSTDASGIIGNAACVYFPKSAEEICRIVASNSNITARGGGSGLAGGAVPLNSCVIDMSKLNKIISIDEARKTAYVEAGVILDELNAELEKKGLEFPVNPSSHAICTIGGMIATNAVGSRAMRYGRTANWVEYIDVVNSRGEIKRMGKADLNDFSGMEGTTGIIAGAVLKLIKKPERTASLIKTDSFVKIAEALSIFRLENDVSMMEFIDKKASELAGLEKIYHLIAEFESGKGEIKGGEYAKLLAVRDSIYPKLASQGYSVIEDPKIFSSKIREFLDYLEDNGIPCFGHLGSGILHPCFSQEKSEKIPEMMRLVKKLHGNITGEHGIGLLKKQFLDDTEKKLIYVIKKRMDRLNKFNPGKMVDFASEKAEEKIENQESKEEQAADAKIKDYKEAKDENKQGGWQ